MPGQTIAAATQQNRPRTAMQIVHSLGPEIQRALPKGMDGDRIARLALTAIRKNPKLGECTSESFAGALLTASAMGLEPDVNGEAYLVPYGRECQLIVGYQGYTKLFWQHPLAKDIDTQPVYEGDEFDWARGLSPFLHHRESRDRDRTKKPILYYWAAVTLSTGGRHFEVLTPEQVKELRGGKVGPDPKFKGGDPQRWMERKTVLRQTLKLVPRSTQLSIAINADERTGSELFMERAAEAEPRQELAAGVNALTGEVTDQAAATAAGEAGPSDAELAAMER